MGWWVGAVRRPLHSAEVFLCRLSQSAIDRRKKMKLTTQPVTSLVDALTCKVHAPEEEAGK